MIFVDYCTLIILPNIIFHLFEYQMFFPANIPWELTSESYQILFALGLKLKYYTFYLFLYFQIVKFIKIVRYFLYFLHFKFVCFCKSEKSRCQTYALILLTKVITLQASGDRRLNSKKGCCTSAKMIRFNFFKYLIVHS